MSGDQSDHRDRAAALVQRVTAGQPPLSNADADALISAVAEDMGTQSEKETLAEERLTKLETQTRVLSDAVIAITDPAEAVAPAIQAVKNEM